MSTEPSAPTGPTTGPPATQEPGAPTGPSAPQEPGAATGMPPFDNPYQPPAAPTSRVYDHGGGGGSGGPDSYGFKPAHWASTAAIVGLSCSVVLAVLSIYAMLDLYWASMSSLSTPGGSAVAAARVISAERFSDRLDMIDRVVFVFTGIPFLIWFHRCYRNLAALHVEGTKYSTGWAVGGWFIPFVNFVRPYQVAREIWNASNPDVHAAEGPLDWLQKRSASIVQIWWALHLIPRFVWMAARSYIDEPSVDKWKIGIWLLILGTLINGAAAVAAVLVIRQLDARQAERHCRLQTIFSSHPLAHLGPEQGGGSADERAASDAGVEDSR